MSRHVKKTERDKITEQPVVAHRVSYVKKPSGPQLFQVLKLEKSIFILLILIISAQIAPFSTATITEDIANAKNNCELCALLCTLDSNAGPGKPYDVCVKTECKEFCDPNYVSDPENDLGVSISTNANSYTVGDQFSITVSVTTLSTRKPVNGASLDIEYYNQNSGQRVTQSGSTDTSGKYTTGFKWSDNSAGTISITVQATSDSYGAASSSKTITVQSKSAPPPATLQASFSAEPSSGIAPLTVWFSDMSSGSPSTWSWSFGDGSTGASQSISHTYHNPGSYRVELTVRNSAGLSSSATKTITANMYVIPVPVSGYLLKANIYSTSTEGPAPHRVDFSDTSTGSVASRLWTFGDGYKSELASPGHTYREPGTYTVRLTVYDGLGQSDSASINVNVQSAGVGTEGVGKGDEPVTEQPIQPPPGSTDGTSSGNEENTNIPLTPGDVTSGLEAGVAGVIGGLIALGAGTGIIPGTSRPPRHISRETMFVDEMKKQLEQSNDVWKMQTEDLVRQQIELLKDNKYYVLNSSRMKSLFNNLIGNIHHSGFGIDYVRGWTGGNCDDFEKWGKNLYTEYFDELKYKMGGGSNLDRVFEKPYTSEMRQGELIGSIGLTNGHGVIRNTINEIVQSITNHTAVLVVRPNGERFVIDYWQSMIDGEPRIYSEKEWIDKWSERLGLEYERTHFKNRIFDNAYLTDRAGLHGSSGNNRLTDYIRNYLDGKPFSSEVHDGIPSPFAATLEEKQIFYERGPMLDLEGNFEKYLNSSPVKKFLEDSADKETAKAIILSFWRDPW